MDSSTCSDIDASTFLHNELKLIKVARGKEDAMPLHLVGGHVYGHLGPSIFSLKNCMSFGFVFWFFLGCLVNCLAALPQFCLFCKGGDALDVLVTLLVALNLGVKEGLEKRLETLGVGRSNVDLA